MKVPQEQEYDFVLALSGITDLSPEAEDALYEAGCDDATICVRNGCVFLAFTRRAPSLKDAVLSAFRDVRKANIGARVARVDESSGEDVATINSVLDFIRRREQNPDLVNHIFEDLGQPTLAS